MDTYEFKDGVLKVLHPTGVHNYCKDYNVQLDKFNMPVVIDPTATSCQYMLYNCKSFNQPLTIPDGVTCCRSMLANCESFNQTIVVPSTVTDCTCMCYNCFALSTAVKIPSTVVYDEDAFFMCPGEYNNETKIYTPGKKEQFTLNQFLNDSELKAKAVKAKINQPSYWFNIAFPEGASSRDEVLAKLDTYKERPVQKPPEKSTEVSHGSYKMFGSKLHIYSNSGIRDFCRDNNIELQEFNEPVELDTEMADCSGTFQNCLSFNWPVDIPTGAIKCSRMFHGCASFSQPLKIGANVTECDWMLFKAEKFDNIIELEEGAVNCEYMCAGCKSLKQIIKIPKSVIQTKEMFSDCPGKYDERTRTYVFMDTMPYKLEDLEKDARTLMQVMEIQYNYRPWFLKNFPDGAESAEAVLAKVKGEDEK